MVMERFRLMDEPLVPPAPSGWLVIQPMRMETTGESFPRYVFVPVHQIVEFGSHYTGVTRIKTSTETYFTKMSPHEFSALVSNAQTAFLASLRGALENLGVKER